MPLLPLKPRLIIADSVASGSASLHSTRSFSLPNHKRARLPLRGPARRVLKAAFTLAGQVSGLGVGSILLAHRTNKLIAAALGILIAVVPVYWFTTWLQGQGEAEVSVAANSSIAFVDLTIAKVVEKLDDLASRGVNSCTAPNIETLRQSAPLSR